ncbi:MAG: phosphatase PAP2 family protein [Oscillospiraceae bacterium]|nr:phosphatase PAP2 family protein [Oscillospiraceae bacterium]
MRDIDFPLKNGYYRHLWYVLVLPIYLICFWICEHIVVNNYWSSYLPLDDLIPFNEIFVIAYVAWYPCLIAMGIALLIRNSGDFRRYMLFIGVGFLSALAFCLIFPNGQDLRPAEFPRDNLLTRVLGMLYAADTNTNVLPSMHVIGAFAFVFPAFEAKSLRSHRWIKVLSVVMAVLICVSTVFVKQHSVLDTLAGIPWSFAKYAAVYLPERKRRLSATEQK